jgi:PucR family transcriptional regulator, purine catabolism regulatory protein
MREPLVLSDAAITVSEALRLRCLSDATLLAGSRGTDRLIRGVNVLEDANIVRWMSGGELLLTTGYTFRDDPTHLSRLIPALSERRVAGLAIKIGLYLDACPSSAALVANRLDFPIIGLPSSVMFNDILAEVFGTVLNRHAIELERSNEIHERLTAVALSGGSFDELALAVAELVGKPVLIRDGHGNQLAATGEVPEDGDVGHVSRPITLGEAPQGEVVMWTGDQSVAAHELKTLEHAATIAAMAIAQERAVVSSEQRHRTLLLMQLVSRRGVDNAEIRRWATAMGWNLELPRTVVLVELHDAEGPVRVAGQWSEGQLTRAAQDASPPDTIVWALRSGLALLPEPKPSAQAVARGVHAALSRILPGTGVMVAVGSVPDELSDLSRSFEDASSTLMLGRELRGHDFVLDYEELGVYRLLSRLSDEDLRHHRDQALGSVLAYDRDHHGALVQTLEAFMRWEGNRVRAAEDLFIHYNTLRYRLSQIERLTAGITGDATARLNVQLALAAHRLLQGRGAE